MPTYFQVCVSNFLTLFVQKGSHQTVQHFLTLLRFTKVEYSCFSWVQCYGFSGVKTAEMEASNGLCTAHNFLPRYFSYSQLSNTFQHSTKLRQKNVLVQDFKNGI
jgi:hypothetical protein